MPEISKARVLIVSTDGFEESELFGPLQILREEGADVKLASPDMKPIQATVHDDPGKTIRPDLTVDQARAEDYDALILPGGVRNPDQLRTNKAAIDLIRAFADADKPVAAICHGPWLLVEADIVRDRTVTAWPSIRTDLKNAGANVVDEEVAIDGSFTTSRSPQDLPAFCAAIVEQFAHARAEATMTAR